MSDIKSMFHILDALDSAILVLDNQQNAVFCNQSFFQLIEQEDKNSSLNLSELFEEPAKLFCPGVQTVTALHSQRGNTLSIFIDVKSVEKFLVISFSKFFNSTKELHTRRLETLGLLSGSIIHDFNNILAAINGHVSYLKATMPTGATDQHQASLEAIEQGSLTAGEVTKEILKFSKTGSLDSTPVDLDLVALIKSSIKLLLGSLRPKTKIEFANTSDQILVKGQEVHVVQILVNLIVNAHDAITEANAKDNTIYISVDRIQNPSSQLGIYSGKNYSGEFAKISVQDNGCGIPEELFSKILQPYFSTKNEKGTGLGLTTVVSLVDSLEGLIDIDSREGSGCLVNVYLPISNEVKLEKSVVEDPVSTPKIDNKILIIDDEQVVNQVMEMNLVEAGFSVKAFCNPLKAIEDYQQDPNYQIVILDMLMPEMSGEEVFHEIRKIKSEQKILIVSGFCSDEIKEELLETGNADFLSKPFRFEQMLSRVYKLLDAQST